MLKKILLEDWMRKLAAIIFALLIYWSVHLQLQEEETFRNVTVVIKSKDNKFCVLGTQSLTTTINVRGAKRNLSNIVNNKIPIIHYIQNPSSGSYIAKIRAHDVELPSGVSVQNIEPSTFTVEVDQLTQKKVKISLDRSPEADGYTLENYRLSPDEITVYGPQSVLDNIIEIFTERVSLKNIANPSWEQEVNLIKKPDVSYSTDSIKVQITMRPNLDSQKFDQIPIKIMSAAGKRSVVLSVKFVDVTVLGSPESLRFLDKSFIDAYVDIDDLKGENELDVVVKIKKNEGKFKRVLISPKKIRVKIKTD